MKILYLYTEVMGYNIAVFESLASEYDASIDVVHWDKNKKTPYTPSASSKKIRFHARSDFSAKSLRSFAINLQPDLVYTSGWQDRGYRLALQKLKSLGVPIVMGLDTQWTGSLRQRIGAKVIKYFYKNRYFSYAWVPGPLQFECAARLGFHHAEIICNLLTGNTDIFTLTPAELNSEKIGVYPRRFLYVGRFTHSKGLDVLINAYKKYQACCTDSWELICIGNGPLEECLRQVPGITVMPFADQNTLAHWARRVGALILPSRYEPWGVVVHEFAMTGLPLLLSNRVGSRHQFLVNGLNGYSFDAHSIDDLAEHMKKLTQLPDSRLLNMGHASLRLAKVLSPSLAAASFVSALHIRPHS